MIDNIYLATIYRLGAVNFRESAKKLSQTLDLKNDGTPTNYTSMPFYFLVSHSAELFLKASLLKRGFDQKDLKKYEFRHSLNSLLEELKKYGVHISLDTVAMINGLHKQHKNHALRYDALISNEKMFFPPPCLMFLMLDELFSLTAISTQGV